MSEFQDVRKHFREKRKEIEGRLEGFQKVSRADDRRWFKELIFVILTSRSHARDSWEAAEKLDEMELLDGDAEDIMDVISSYDISYERDKSSYIVENRKKLSQPTLADPGSGLKLKSKVDEKNPKQSRDWLVKNLKGIGWKGGSHFLRNVGCGDEMAIISGPIVNQLNELGVDVSRPSNREEYVEIEERVKKMAEKLDIDVQAFDLVLWSMRTGEVFK